MNTSEITPAELADQRMRRRGSMPGMEIEGGGGAPVSHSDRPLSEILDSWRLDREAMNKLNRKNQVNLGFVGVWSHTQLFWTIFLIFVTLVICVAVVLSKYLPKHRQDIPPLDNYAIALKKSLLFFDAQMSGQLPEDRRIPWRGDSGLRDGFSVVKGGLVGGYYDSGKNIKSTFPMAFSMTLLSWTVLEYSHKYEAIGEYDHIREIIEWGTDYLLRTFDSSASTIDTIYYQVGEFLNGSTTADDHYCWQRPEDMNYLRPVEGITSGSDLAAEMAAALASAAIVFRDNANYSQKLVKAATTLFSFARDTGRGSTYSSHWDPSFGNLYSSTDYYDEYLWGAAWMYYATGSSDFLSLATEEALPEQAKAFSDIAALRVLSWDNKLPAAQLLLSRLRIFLSPGFPFENMLKRYHDVTGLTMCSYLQRFQGFKFTQGGMILLNPGDSQPLQYVVNAAYIATLFADYLGALEVPGWYCGEEFISVDVLRDFATTQVDYILGANPNGLSYVVGYGSKFPLHVHHRGASIPDDGTKYSCTGGWKWRDSRNPNPNNITGAMVGGPDKNDTFHDVRTNYSYTEPTLAGNAGLVAALVSLTSNGGNHIDKNTIFTEVPPLHPSSPSPPPPWKPF